MCAKLARNLLTKPLFYNSFICLKSVILWRFYDNFQLFDRCKRISLTFFPLERKFQGNVDRINTLSLVYRIRYFLANGIMSTHTGSKSLFNSILYAPSCPKNSPIYEKKPEYKIMYFPTMVIRFRIKTIVRIILFFPFINTHLHVETHAFIFFFFVITLDIWISVRRGSRRIIAR